MPVSKLLLDGPVKSFQIAVSFRVLGIVKEMHQTFLLAALLEMLGEFTAVVGLDSPGDKRSDVEELTEEITTGGRGVRFIGVSEGKSGTDIDGGKDVALKAISEDSSESVLIRLRPITGGNSI